MQYIIGKGTVIPKGKKVEVRLRKFSAASFGTRVPVLLKSLLTGYFLYLDSIFETDLYASDSDGFLRYTDEGEMKKLCRCSVDLQVLPVYQEQTKARPFGGFYTGEDVPYRFLGAEK